MSGASSPPPTASRGERCSRIGDTSCSGVDARGALRDGVATWGRLDGDTVVLSDGGVLPQAGAHFLAPVQPTKILATHLAYQSRVTEYAMARPPAEPAWFLKPPTALSGHRQEIRRPPVNRQVGGDGVVRKIRFREPMTGAILSGRRKVAPFGLNGGGSATPGKNYIERADGKAVELKACDETVVDAGDAIVIETPGGGGYGTR